MKPRLHHVFTMAMVALFFSAGPASALTPKRIPDPLFPIKPVIADKKADEVYPSVAGDFLVYSKRQQHAYSVVRLSKRALNSPGRVIAPTLPREAIRFGVALRDGAVGYVSNRMGPISAWMRHAHGDGHVAIANLGTFNGALMPMYLHASHDGRIWCFESNMDKTRRAQILNDYGDGFMHVELVGQVWRINNSEVFRYKLQPLPVKAGSRNRFRAPALFIFNRTNSQLTIIQNASGGAISPDGKRVVFVRENKGNYDLWMQNVDGGQLKQLTDTPFGEFEPAWSPDGKRIAFISNRDSEGDVRATSIYIMNLANGRVQRLTNALEATDGGPAWLNNHTLLFHSNRDTAKPQLKTTKEWNIWQLEIGGAK